MQMAIAEKSTPAPARPAKPQRSSPVFTLPLSVSREELLDKGGETDHRFRQLLFDFSSLGASLEIARAHLASLLGLSSPQYNITMILASHQNSGGISVSGVARMLHVSTAFITAEAGKLEHLGLVEKRANPKDGRGILLYLTTKGQALVQRVGPERQLVNDHLFSGLSRRAFRDLAKTLSSMIDDFAPALSLLKEAQTGDSRTLAASASDTKSKGKKHRKDRGVNA
jgi:DNA-binding MarR family transcriptional regulator